MKSNTYILKRVYLERNAEREYRQHQKRLEEIKTHPIRNSVSQKVAKIDELMIKSKEMHYKANDFTQTEKLRDEKVENKALISKLLEINDGRFAISNLVMDPVSAKSNTVKQPSLFKSVSGATTLNQVSRKQWEERVLQENHAFAKRMIDLPPVIKKKEVQDKEFEQVQSIKKNILRFHTLKEKPEKQYKRLEAEEDDGINEFDDALMDQKVHILVSLKEISFINFLPQSSINEQYFFEIQASIRGLRRTVPENFEDFSKSVVNEQFVMRELKKSKVLYIGLWQTKKGKERFLGDFELDLTPYYKEEGHYTISFDLRNYKELRQMPNYMHKDMRKKGYVTFTLQVRSHIKQYLMDNVNVQTDKNQNKVIDTEPANKGASSLQLPSINKNQDQLSNASGLSKQQQQQQQQQSERQQVSNNSQVQGDVSKSQVQGEPQSEQADPSQQDNNSQVQQQQQAN